jgi:hypothetical protein
MCKRPALFRMERGAGVQSLGPEEPAGNARLLKEFQSDHAELFLTSRDNTPLWTASVEGDRTPRNDLVLKQWRKAKPGIPLKAFRSISATKLESHPVYGRTVSLFLGHSPRGVAERHYAAAPEALLHEGLAWLRTQFFQKFHDLATSTRERIREMCLKSHLFGILPGQEG